MAFPTSLNKAKPADSDLAVYGASDIRKLRRFVEDIFGIEDSVSYSAAAFAIEADGRVSLSQVPLLVAGTEAAPGLAFAGQADTGLRLPSASVLDLVTAGADRWRLTASGHLVAADDNAYDIGGAGGPNRPRDLMLAGNLTGGGYIEFACEGPPADPTDKLWCADGQLYWNTHGFPYPTFRILSGSYVGNGQATQTISGLGFAPKFVMTGPSTLGPKFIRGTGWSDSRIVDDSIGRDQAQCVLTLDADGFTVGTAVNSNGTTYYYCAFGGDLMEAGQYSGNNADDRNISLSVSQTPRLVAIWHNDNTEVNGLFWTTGYGDQTPRVGGASSSRVDLIQSSTTGSFQVGTRANKSGKVYGWVAFFVPEGKMGVTEYNGQYSPDKTVTFETPAKALPEAIWVQHRTDGTGANNGCDFSCTIFGPNKTMAGGSSGLYAGEIKSWTTASVVVGAGSVRANFYSNNIYNVWYFVDFP